MTKAFSLEPKKKKKKKENDITCTNHSQVSGAACFHTNNKL